MRRIVIRPTGSPAEQAFLIADYVVTRGSGSRLCLSLRPRIDAQVQRTHPTRDLEIRQFDRGGESTDLVAVVQYEFSDQLECDRFLWDLANNVPRMGRLTFSTRVGDASIVRTLDNCWCRPITVMDQMGVSATIQFSFQGGKFIAVPDQP